MKIQMTWVEDERVTTRYVATVNVPDEFAWDEDAQREYLDDQRCEHDYTGLPGETVIGEVVDSEIEGWVVQTPVPCGECGQPARVDVHGQPSDTVADQPMCTACLTDYLEEVGSKPWGEE